MLYHYIFLCTIMRQQVKRRNRTNETVLRVPSKTKHASLPNKGLRAQMSLYTSSEYYNTSSFSRRGGVTGALQKLTHTNSN